MNVYAENTVLKHYSEKDKLIASELIKNIKDNGETASQNAVKNLQKYSRDKNEGVNTAESVFNAVNKQTSQGNKAATQIFEHSQSESFQAEKQKWKNHLTKSMGFDAWDTPTLNDNADSEPMIFSERPILFISTSIPLTTLRNYAADLEKVRGVMALRGFKDGIENPLPTMKFIASILRVNPQCEGVDCKMRNVQILIDPILFREYAIKKVPSFTIHGATDLGSYCSGSSDELNKNDVVLVGDSKLKYLIEKLGRENNTNKYNGLIAALKSTGRKK